MPEHLKRHCMVVYSYYPLGETRVQREAEVLVEAGYQVDVICPRLPGDRPKDEFGGVSVRRLPMRIRGAGLLSQLLGYVVFMLGAGLMLTARHLRRRYDSVQVHNLPDFLVFSALGPKIMGAPVILDIHDLMPEFLASRFDGHPPGWLSATVQLQERLACRFADHVITVSDLWRETLAVRGLPMEKSSVVMNVADEKIFHSPITPKAQKGERLALIYHGTVVHRYGLDLVVEALRQLRSEASNLSLKVLGKGDAMPALKAQIQRLGLEDRVTLIDDLVPAEDLPAIIHEADMGIVPYRNDQFTDGLIPTKLLEYSALSVPIIAARTSAIQALCGDNSVHYFRPGDAAHLARQLLELYRDPQRREDLAEATADINRRHSWSDEGPRYVELIRGLST